VRAGTDQLQWKSIGLRTLWLLGVLFAVYVLISGYPGFVSSLYSPCSEPSGVSCNRLQIHVDQMPALERYGVSLQGYALYAISSDMIVTAFMIGVGMIIIWRKPADRMCQFVSLLLIVFGAFGMNESHAIQTPSRWLELVYMMFVILKWPALGILFCTFPDGKFVPRWSWMLIFLFVIQLVLFMLPYPYNIENWPSHFAILEMLLVYGSVTSVLLYRFFAVATPLQKQQIKWLAFGFGTTLVLVITINLLPLFFASFDRPESFYHLLGPVSTAVSYLPIPVGIGIALLRYRLWDIDIVINRTLVYLALSTNILVVYVLVVFGMSAFFQVYNSLFISLLATALIAVIIQPLRLRLQRGVNRLMFGDRIDPYRALANLGRRLEESLPADNLLQTIVKSVAQALRLPYAAIVWDKEQRLVGGEHSHMEVTYGRSLNSGDKVRLPLIHQGEHVGDLVLSPRQQGEELTPADVRLVRDLAPQISIAVHSVRLTADLQRMTIDLQRSRERLVTAREEERRRMRRDLHDGLGPLLSSQTLTLSAVKKQLRQDPDTAEKLLADAIAHAKEAITDIRRLVYALRPPALDDLGLLAVLREQVSRYHASGIKIMLNVPETLPPLPAAAEMACYRIVQEALTNIVHHAHATSANILLRVKDGVTLEVTDNGQGLPPSTRGGVGFSSMHERAEELGGTCRIENMSDGGTRVIVNIPLPQDQHESTHPSRKAGKLL
jgi:signal transduction histidine kinase